MSIQEMLKALSDAGFSQAQIAAKVGTTQPTICRAGHGAAISYELGKAIEEMHRKQMRAMRRKAA